MRRTVFTYEPVLTYANWVMVMKVFNLLKDSGYNVCCEINKYGGIVKLIQFNGTLKVQ